MNGLARRIRQARRWLFGREGPIILLYHRIAAADVDPWGLCVSKQRFAEQMEVLRRHATTVSLSDLVAAHREQKLARQMVAVTFDDGYADNLHAAKPVLERFEVPATVFLVTGAIGRRRRFWWDELAHLLLEAGTLPPRLELPLAGAPYAWTLDDATQYTVEQVRRNRDWRASQPPVTSRHAIFVALWRMLQKSTPAVQEDALDRLAVWADRQPTPPGDARPLNITEAARLSDSGLIDVGAHSVNHVVLPAHPEEQQRREIEDSKRACAQLVNRDVHHFAYPHGAFSTETVEVVQRTGFAAACTTSTDCVSARTDRFRLPRLWVRDWDGDEFARRLAWRL